MALEGTLRDFSLADIFQLIGLQKKTGILTLRNDKETARIFFMNGLVVGSDTDNQKLENRLGRVLVKTNRITQSELDQALQHQSRTLQRLGQVLVQKGFIKQEDLRESLQIQVTQVVYRLFRWEDGVYHFRPETSVEYDQENFTPITSESILMEGVRMLDEWPIIEKLVPNFEVVVDRTERGKSLRLQSDRKFSLDSSDSEDYESAFENIFKDGGDTGIRDERDLGLSHHQEVVLKLLTRPTVVQELIDRSGFNEFDTCHTIHHLMEMGLVYRVVDDVEHHEIHIIEEIRHIPIWLPASLLAMLILLGLLTSWNPLNHFLPYPTALERNPSNYKTESRLRLQFVVDALDQYFLHKNGLPIALGVLTRQNFLKENQILDPLGRELRYEMDPNENRYRLWAISYEGAVGYNELVVEKVYPQSSLP